MCPHPARSTLCPIERRTFLGLTVERVVVVGTPELFTRVMGRVLETNTYIQRYLECVKIPKKSHEHWRKGQTEHKNFKQQEHYVENVHKMADSDLAKTKNGKIQQNNHKSVREQNNFIIMLKCWKVSEQRRHEIKDIWSNMFVSVVLLRKFFVWCHQTFLS